MKMSDLRDKGVQIRNVNGTSGHSCRCSGGWLAHWKLYGGVEGDIKCAVCGCENLAEVGAHVQKADSGEDDWYIVPFCRAHNQKADKMTVSDTTEFVSANVSVTCGK